MNSHHNFRARAVLKVGQHPNCRSILLFILTRFTNQIVMKQTFCDRCRRRICVGFERIITQAKELKQAPPCTGGTGI